MTSHTHPATVLYLSVTVLLALCHGCFIRSCPKGGKRLAPSVDDMLQEDIRLCLECGPARQGRCVGPTICCGRHFGCLINTPDSKLCEEENDISTPCTSRGRHCGQDSGGVCVAHGVCCSYGACVVTEECQDEEMLPPDSKQIAVDEVRLDKLDTLEVVHHRLL